MSDKRCPSCRAVDNNPYIDGKGQHMRACGRCMIQWRVNVGDTPVLLAWIVTLLLHDGGAGSKDYDASAFMEARRKLQSLASMTCPKCGEHLPHLYDENCTDYSKPELPRPDCELLSSPESVLAFEDELNPEDDAVPLDPAKAVELSKVEFPR